MGKFVSINAIDGRIIRKFGHFIEKGQRDIADLEAALQEAFPPEEHMEEDQDKWLEIIDASQVGHFESLGYRIGVDLFHCDDAETTISLKEDEIEGDIEID